MKIGIFANYLIFEKAGVGKYTQNLIKNLLEIDKKENQYFLYFSFLRQRRQRRALINDFLGQIRPKNVTVRIIPLPARWYEFITSTPFPMTKILQDKIDIFFAPYVSGIPRLRPASGRGFGGQAKMVVTIHDLVFLRFPEHRGKKLSNYYLRRHKIAIKNCQKIIVPSDSTKKDLHDFLDVPTSKIKVIKEAADSRFRTLSSKAQRQAAKIIGRYFDPKIKYILSVGTLEPRKNLIQLVGAYSLLPHAILNEYHLVLVGAKGWNNGDLNRTIANLNLKNRVVMPGFVKDEDLPYIYNKAALFVYPSLYEGFGLPPLEAMACGVPVVVSNNSSLPEVVGKAALIIEAQNEEQLARAMKRVILKPKLRQKLVEQGYLQAKKFSWKKAAQETLQVFKDLYPSRPPLIKGRRRRG